MTKFNTPSSGLNIKKYPIQNRPEKLAVKPKTHIIEEFKNPFMAFLLAPVPFQKPTGLHKSMNFWSCASSTARVIKVTEKHIIKLKPVIPTKA